MRVVFCAFDTPGFVCGPNSWLRRLLPLLRAGDVDVRVIAIGSPRGGETVGALRADGFRCEVVAFGDTHEMVRQVLTSLARDPPDVFVPNCLVAGFYAAAWAREFGIPTVGIMHSDDEFYRAVVDRFVLGVPRYRLSALVCVSEWLQSALCAHRVPDGLIVRHIAYGVPSAQTHAREPNGTLRIVYVGRLVEEQKRISSVVHAMCAAVREVPGTEAVIYGSGDALGKVQAILRTQPPGFPVVYGGVIDSDRIYQELSGAHVLTLMSDYEGLPIALMEAMACGVVPVCRSGRSGILELVEDGKTGIIVGENPEELVRAVKRLREELGTWTQLSQAARDRIACGYTSDACATAWIQLLRDLVPVPRAAASIKVPRFLHLPRVHPGLAREDWRRPPLYGRVLRQVKRIAASALRRVSSKARVVDPPKGR